MLVRRFSGATFVRGGKSSAAAKVCAAVLIAGAGLFASFNGVAEAKTPGTIHCYGGWCHRINSIGEMDGMVGRRGVVTASYYDDCRRDRFNPCGLTSSGAIFRPDQPDNAASPIFPDGTILLTYNPATRLSAVVRVTSAGPYRGDRTLDVSRATAEHLGFINRGVATLEVAILKSPNEQEARYRKLREYAPVPGFIGRFETFEAAHDSAIAKLKLVAANVAVTAADPVTEIVRLFPRARAEAVRDTIPGKAFALPVAELMTSASVEVAEIQTLETSDADVVRTVSDADELRSVDQPPEPVVAADATEIDHPVLERIAAFIEYARSQAPPRAEDGYDVLAASSAFESNMTFTEWAKSFVRAAQVRARLGAASQMSGKLASR